jgi:hypothetical protein
VGGRYLLLASVGRGRSGSVRRAHDELLGRDVAMKRLHVGRGPRRLAVRMVRERAHRDSRVAARLHDPRLAAIYDITELDGEVYLMGRVPRASRTTPTAPARTAARRPTPAAHRDQHPPPPEWTPGWDILTGGVGAETPPSGLPGRRRPGPLTSTSSLTSAPSDTVAHDRGELSEADSMAPHLPRRSAGARPTYRGAHPPVADPVDAAPRSCGEASHRIAVQTGAALARRSARKDGAGEVRSRRTLEGLPEPRGSAQPRTRTRARRDPGR